MNSNKTLYTIIVHSENIAGILNQITAVFTRRQINIESLNVSASSIKGVHKYTITCWTTPDVIDKVVTQIEKKIDVIQAHYFTDKEIFQRDHVQGCYSGVSGQSGSFEGDSSLQRPYRRGESYFFNRGNGGNER